VQPKVTHWESVLDDLPAWEPPDKEGTIFAPSSWLHAKPIVLMRESEELPQEPSGEYSSASNSSAPPAHQSVNPMVTTPWGKVKGALFLSSLFSLRRVSIEEDKEAQLFRQTLGDLHDTAAQLSHRKEELQEGISTTLATGGDRHPTVILYRRCLAVVERKMALLAELEEKCAAFESIHNRGEELWGDVLAGKILGESVVGVAAGFRSFVKHIVHQGDPVQTDKSDFNYFVSRLGLPPGHDLLVRSQKALHDKVKASCRCVLDLFASKAAGLPDAEVKALAVNTLEAVNLLLLLSTPSKQSVVRQLKAEAMKLRARYVSMEVKEASHVLERATENDGPLLLRRAGDLRQAVLEAVEFGVAHEVEEIKQAKLMVLGLRAHTVLSNAKRLQNDDKERPDNRRAVHSAGTIREEVQAASEFGCLANDTALAEARHIADSLYAIKVLRQAQREKEEDTRALDKNVCMSGDATAAAERIDAEIKEAVQFKVPSDHDLIEEARKVAQYLREQEFLRKRMLASNARRQGP